MNRLIGYYVHHHGAGHLTRALAIADQAGGRIVLIGTGLAGRTGAHRCIDLPDDRIDAAFDGRDDSENRSASLHYTPTDHDGIRRRVAALTGWIADEAPALIVVDVSCEIAMLARLASVPTVCIRLSGRRDDPPHLEAFRAATALIAPFAAALDDDAMPSWVAEKTLYCPGIVSRPAATTVDPATVLVVLGRGAPAADAAVWTRAARAMPERRWSVIGPLAPVQDAPDNLAILGWVDDAADRITRAGVVVGSAGDGVVGAILAAGRPFICLPEDRPFEEQRSKARALARAGAAIVCDDAKDADWPALIASAEALDPAAAAALDDPSGAARAAAHLLSLADRGTPS